VCNSRNPGEEKCDNPNELDGKRFSKRCSTFDDAHSHTQADIHNAAHVNSTLYGFPDWSILSASGSTTKQFQGFCKKLKIVTRSDEPPGTRRKYFLLFQAEGTDFYFTEITWLVSCQDIIYLYFLVKMFD
jgi:hypothetical protein